jgi:excisionase family DNA binding protein
MKKATLTPTELAKQRGQSLTWIYTQIRLGKIPATKQGKTWAIPQTAVKSAA